MFSFHKPKVYRSSTGCCICKAKSSSSRFTDSKKYEDDFMECFQLLERRTGEICNACVLLVKRWKKLPAGSDRNWSHVVDARAGPGIKSLTKFKSKNKKKLKETQDKHEKIIKKKHVYLKPDRDREQSPAMSDEYTEDFLPGATGGGGGSKNSSRAGSPAGSDDGSAGVKRLADDQGESGIKRRLPQLPVSGFIDMTYFKRETICCGTIFKGEYGEVIIDPSLIKPCIGCLARQRQRQANAVSSSPSHSSASASPAHSSASASPAHSVDSTVEATATKPVSKSFSDSSSDSGYDESSNQGVGESKLAKIIQNSIPVAKQEIKAIPIKSVQLKAIPVSEAIRLNSDLPIKLVPLKQVEQILYKPISLASPAIVTASNTSSHQSLNVPGNPLIDFAIHASARQSIAN
ncbi:SIN3-HDAC complex-associated factor [Athalia rosae]|uniref:SIN3-HDAC complex-associated factor n=1 Tax=Athalia rosae TaxID=37344 RepID=UPI002034432B|nr:SIN3-HDAC complex-associated factor [Athalia rosae]XP_048515393.1 SIN3-HDAC complex-associated factor [Athalia rosae]